MALLGDLHLRGLAAKMLCSLVCSDMLAYAEKAGRIDGDVVVLI